MPARPARLAEAQAENAALILEVAQDYFLRDRSKVAIAERTGLSRWQIARLLEEAKAKGIVSIEVGDPGRLDAELAERLADTLGIDAAVVVGRSQRLQIAPTVDTLAVALAEHLTDRIRPGDRLGLAWSQVIEAMPRHLHRLSPCDVVQLCGAITYPGDRLGSVEVIREVARTAEGTAYPIYAPLYAPDPATARALSDQPDIRDVLERARQVDVAVVGIGTWTPEGSSLYPVLPPPLARRAAVAGACGGVAGRVFDAAGRPVSDKIDARVIGLTADELRAIPAVIATSHGAHRADAVIAAVRAGFVQTLLVDESLATAIVDRLR
ncbi:sugar-binding transcriptional regulator [Microlunatus soli]|uniref:DNA-binding transcriptional regulator LsrR, DeoR family n=1 Tax=Microlunatus soli TaxID=630515 RepID=A0A1H1VKV9_9ACTN|nr:sugar-binding domain-containing protein [Microlunatus soli]SDS85160.1 DNA-binding transcriptional regulator LsrR, DeoR family [Microlunatus soli]